ncbi:uncharacterized protein HMPREF1541_06839 [Cyphellophora europaea CBS 101466]|uniref:Uncharacterized protein n=1 Tax=Cyphellophora europaea (strain CBS 101466) TaxID=1220924 RepID=W2RR49_CYPE1|nr:uncharacterized protein HMPREF1541_06839 [Cyphellophora europaea CBS 101466]ETN38800.1 hypothetical protein HMPREF1541_06839 [Cyphellophora europaea CBS 101466]
MISSQTYTASNFHILTSVWTSTITNTNTSSTIDPNDACLGDAGKGNLHPTFGDGEYLDTLSIQHAQVAATHAGALPMTNIRYLPLQHVAVDDLRWFDPAKLQTIDFRAGCIDAGFYLGGDMKNVVLKTPITSSSPA